jgi:hypothetical protein
MVLKISLKSLQKTRLVFRHKPVNIPRIRAILEFLIMGYGIDSLTEPGYNKYYNFASMETRYRRCGKTSRIEGYPSVRLFLLGLEDKMAKKLLILDGEYFFCDDESGTLKKVVIKEDINIKELSDKQAKELLLLISDKE